MIKKHKNGLPNPHTGACQTSACLAVSSAGREVSLSAETISWLGRPCSTHTDPSNEHKNQKTRNPEDNRNALRSTPVLLSKASEVNARIC